MEGELGPGWTTRSSSSSEASEESAMELERRPRSSPSLEGLVGSPSLWAVVVLPLAIELSRKHDVLRGKCQIEA